MPVHQLQAALKVAHPIQAEQVTPVFWIVSNECVNVCALPDFRRRQETSESHRHRVPISLETGLG